MKKELADIKHGEKVYNVLQQGGMFVEDIRRASGLDQKTLVKVVQQMAKHGWIMKNRQGQWSAVVPMINLFDIPSE